jgi:hypothetical protein
MADRKISDLTALTAPAAGDYLPIVDISEASAANKNKRITIEELLRGAPDGTAAAPGIGFESDPNTGIYRPGADQLAISTGGTGRLFVDSAGNVGIGTSSPGSIFDVKPSASASTIRYEVGTLNSDSIRISAGGTVNTYLEYRGYLGHAWFVDATERARIDSSGRLLVGTSSTSATCNALLQTGSGTGGTLILAYGNTSPGDGQDLGFISFNDSNHIYNSAIIRAARDGGTWTSGTSMPTRLTFSTTADGASSPTERMRIDSAGALKTSTNGTYKFGTGTQELTHNDTTSTIHLAASNTSFTGDAVTISTYRNTTNDTYKFLSCIRQGFAVALEIRDDGDVYNVNGTYGSLSDAKLKENIIDAQSQWDDIRQLRVRNYNFKPETNNSTHKQIGVIAQELETVSPGLVNTVSDRDAEGNDLGTVTKSVNYSVLYMKAVKALQEAMERIETLEAKVAALEAA